MIRLALITLAVLLGWPATSFSQDSLRTSADSVMVDSTGGKQAVPVNPDLTDSAKVPIDETKIFDPSTFPPSLGEREAIKADLRRPPKPQNRFSDIPKSMHGSIKAGFGMYVSPLAEGWVGTTSSSSDVMLRGALRSTEGDTPNRGEMKGNAQLTSGLYFSENSGFLSNGRLQSSIAIDHATYRLYGSMTPERRRTMDNLDGTAGVAMSYADGGYFSARFSFSQTTMSDSSRWKSTVLGSEVSAGTRFSNFGFDARAQFSYDFYTRPTYFVLPIPNPTFAEGTLTVHYRPSDKFDLYATAIAFDGRGTEYRKRTWITSGAGLMWHVGKVVSLFAEYKPSIQQNTFAAFAKANPFLDEQVEIEHTEYYKRATAGIEIAGGKSFAGKFWATYQEAHKLPIFWHRREHLWSVLYSWDARILSFHSEIHASIDENVSVGATFSYNSTRDVEGDRRLPYNPNVFLTVLYRHRLSSRLLIESEVQHIGSRYALDNGNMMLRPLTNWNATAQYSFSQRVTMTATIENILGQRRGYWDGYEQLPRRGSFALQVMW